MNYRLLLALLLATVSVVALRAADDDEDDFADPGYYANSKSTLRFGYRVTSGAKVHFGNLGTVPFLHTIAPASAGEADRTYDNGIVAKDVARVDEGYPSAVTPDVGQSLPSTVQLGNGRYQTFLTTNDNGTLKTVQTGEFLGLASGQTRMWSYQNASQVTADGQGIMMSQYSATSDGAGFDGKKELSAGVELEVAQYLGKIGKRWEVSLVGGFSLNGIHNRQAGNVTSTLHTLRDTYSLLGQTAPTAPYLTGSATQESRTLPDGTVILYETTVPLASVPDPASRVETEAAGAANISGVWRIKGAYYVMRVGPEIRASITENFGLRAGLGFSGAYVGTNYTATEQLNIDGVSNPITTTENSEHDKFMPGFYANMDAEYALNERTGFFAGVSLEQYGDYSQSVGGRTAKIDLGTTASLRGGINIKF
ncbi:MAG: hypothetical protein HYV95_15880 [Opitutae bacterium]|nr:hypothetical protein [Opitutae bacterium]